MTAQAVTVTSTVTTQTAKIKRGYLTLSSSYATNGEAVAASALGLQHIDEMFLVPRGVTPFATQIDPKWDPVNRKIVCLNTGFPKTRKGAVAGGATGNITCTGILIATDQLVRVLGVCGGAAGTTNVVRDQTSEFAICADATIGNVGGTATVNGCLMIEYFRPADQEVANTTDLSGTTIDFVAYEFA